MTANRKIMTLVIHAPDYRVKEGAKSFETVFADGVGVSYIISSKDISRLPPYSTTVVLLRKDKNKRRAEGNLVELVPTVKTPRGKKRYDVHFGDQKEVPYKSERLDRSGVVVIGR